VKASQGLDYDQTINGWRETRQALRTLIGQMPAKILLEPFEVPWGEKTSLLDLVELFLEHEQDHIRDILEWQKNADKPYEKRNLK
jgi:hypothetical protein